MTHKTSLAALVKATASTPGRFVQLLEVQAFAPETSIDALCADFAGMHDLGYVTKNGLGQLANVRFDGVIWSAGDGSFGYIQSRGRWPQTNIDLTLSGDMEAVKCS